MEFIGKIEDDLTLLDEKSIVIYGAGKVGKATYDYLEQKNGATAVKAFCDGKLAGKTYKGVPIVTVDVACHKYTDTVFVVASMSVRQMTEILQSYNIKRIHIIRESE
jgi:NADH/NAD ratio-sensing transcriptional regulator Rex